MIKQLYYLASRFIMAFDIINDYTFNNLPKIHLIVLLVILIKKPKTVLSKEFVLGLDWWAIRDSNP